MPVRQCRLHSYNLADWVWMRIGPVTAAGGVVTAAGGVEKAAGDVEKAAGAMVTAATATGGVVTAATAAGGVVTAATAAGGVVTASGDGVAATESSTIINWVLCICRRTEVVTLSEPNKERE